MEVMSAIDTLIPFALHEQSRLLVDVAAVEKGRRCGCICPSCATPLIARQGNRKQWHFAHESRGVHQETLNACRYSLTVSIRLMIRQIAESGLTLATPALKGHLDMIYRGQPKSVSYRVTTESTVDLSQVQVEAAFSSTTVDALGQVGSLEVAIFLSHSGRPVPEDLYTPQNPRSGVLAIDVEVVASELGKASDGQYTKRLSQYLAESLRGKRWVYHPRQGKAQMQAQQRAESMLSITRPKNWQLECAMCRRRWHGEHARDRRCPNCETHLYTRDIQ